MRASISMENCSRIFSRENAEADTAKVIIGYLFRDSESDWNANPRDLNIRGDSHEVFKDRVVNDLRHICDMVIRNDEIDLLKLYKFYMSSWSYTKPPRMLYLSDENFNFMSISDVANFILLGINYSEGTELSVYNAVKIGAYNYLYTYLRQRGFEHLLLLYALECDIA